MIDEVPVREMALRPENLQYRFAIALNRFTILEAVGLRGGVSGATAAGGTKLCAR
jgi:hypothetical protein